MSKIEIANYLKRINYIGATEPTIESLNALQKQHLLNIPFENIDIHYKIPIELNLPKIFEKVINKRRGGFCYELNGIFYELLRSIGFNVKMVSARVFNYNQQIFSPEFDHLAIIAKINSIDYLADVGYGEFAFHPLQIELNKTQDDERGIFRIEKYDDKYYEVSKMVDKNWIPEYTFSLKERDLSEFENMCLYHQTSPQSHFHPKQIMLHCHRKGQDNLNSGQNKNKGRRYDHGTTNK